jgi:hypothetical protein
MRLVQQVRITEEQHRFDFMNIHFQIMVYLTVIIIIFGPETLLTGFENVSFKKKYSQCLV